MILVKSSFWRKTWENEEKLLFSQFSKHVKEVSRLVVNESILLKSIDNFQFTKTFNFANCASTFEIFFFSKSELKKDGRGLDGARVKIYIKAFIYLVLLNVEWGCTDAAGCDRQINFITSFFRESCDGFVAFFVMMKM